MCIASRPSAIFLVFRKERMGVARVAQARVHTAAVSRTPLANRRDVRVRRQRVEGLRPRVASAGHRRGTAPGSQFTDLRAIRRVELTATRND
jgi:hypothetical protein